MIKLIKSTFYNENKTKKELIAFIKNAKQLSIGSECYGFEQKFSNWQGSKYSVLFNSGSSANLALIQAMLNLDLLKPGMRVGVSGITWATNVMPLIQLGLDPIPIDIELDTLNVSPKLLKRAHERYSLNALFLTNLLGFADDLVQIQKYCNDNNIYLLEDNCESLGSEIEHKKLGNFGLASTFSFFVGHHMSAIEGGMVITDDLDLYNMLQMVRSHGWDRQLTSNEQRRIRSIYKINEFESKYTFYDLAYNLRPTEITGFLGNIQLNYIDETVRIREDNFRKFMKIFASDKFYLLKLEHMDLVSNFAMPMICRSEKLKRKAISVSKENGIEIRPIVGGVMADQPFFKKYVKKKFKLPNSRMIHTNGFYFGNNPELTKSEIESMVNIYKSL